MRREERATIMELAALLEVTGVHAWRLATALLRPVKTGGLLTVSVRDALALRRRRDADPPNARHGRKTYVQALRSRASVSRGPAGQSPAPAGTKKGGGRRQGNPCPVSAAPAVPSPFRASWDKRDATKTR